MNTNKTFSLFFVFTLLAGCAPIFAPQSNNSTVPVKLPVTQSPIPNSTATYTATFTPTSFPPGFTPSPVPIVIPICHEGPVEELQFDVPAPTDLKWEMVNNFQRLSGLDGPVNAAHPSPDGRWWVIEFVTKRESTQYELSLEEALYVLDSLENKHWIASANGKDIFHRFDWFPNGDLFWVDDGQLFRANADGQEKQIIQAPEPVIELWLDKITGIRAFVSGQSALWRFDLSTATWEKVEGLESLVRNGEPPISRVQANLRVSNDGSFGALLADHQIWKVPMAFGEPAHKIGEVDYLVEGWRPEAPQPLVDSPYWYPGLDAYDPRTADSTQGSLVLINEEDGSLLSLNDIVQSYSDTAFYTTLAISPDARWISILNIHGSTVEGLYLLPASQLSNGRVLKDAYVFDWDPSGVKPILPRQIDHPAIVFIIKGEIRFENATLNKMDLVTGEIKMVKKIGVESIPLVKRMTWVDNIPIYVEGITIERVTEDGTLQPIGQIPELHSYEYPRLLMGGAKDQLLFTTAVDKAIDSVCRTQYSLYIAKLDFVK